MSDTASPNPGAITEQDSTLKPDYPAWLEKPTSATAAPNQAKSPAPTEAGSPPLSSPALPAAHSGNQGGPTGVAPPSLPTGGGAAPSAPAPVRTPVFLVVVGAWFVLYGIVQVLHVAMHGLTLLLVVGFVTYLVWLTARGEQLLNTARNALQMQETLLARTRQSLSDVTEEAVCKEKDRGAFLLSKLPPDAHSSIVGRRITRLSILARTRITSDQVISDLLTRREDLGSQDARFTAGILVFVALAGTVLCMAITLAALPKFDARDTNFASLNDVIGQMLPAFLITFVGIVCTVWLSLRNNAFASRQDTFLLDVEEFSLDVLAPRLLANPLMADAARMEAIQRDMSQATTGLSTLIVNVEKQISDMVRESLRISQQNAHEFQSKLLKDAEHFSREMKDAASEIALAGNRLADSSDSAARVIAPAVSAATQAQEAARALAEVSREAGSVIRESSGSLNVTLQDFSLAVKQLPDHLGALAAACDRVELAVTTLRADQSAIRTGMTDAAQAWQSVGQQLDALSEVMKQTFTQVQQTLIGVEQHFVTEQTAFVDALRGLRDQTQQSLVELASLQQHMLDGIGTRFDAAADKHNAATTRTFEALYDQLQTLMTDFTPALHSLQEAAQELQGTTHALEGVANTQNLQTVTRLLSELPATVSQALYASGPAGDLRAASELLTEAANTSVRQTGETTQELLKRVDTLTHAVVTVRDQMPRKRTPRAPRPEPAVSGSPVSGSPISRALEPLKFWKRRRK